MFTVTYFHSVANSIFMPWIVTSYFPYFGTKVTTILSSFLASKSSNKSVNPSLKQVLTFMFLCKWVCGKLTKLPANSVLLGLITFSSSSLINTSNFTALSLPNSIPSITNTSSSSSFSSTAFAFSQLCLPLNPKSVETSHSLK